MVRLLPSLTMSECMKALTGHFYKVQDVLEQITSITTLFHDQFEIDSIDQTLERFF